MKPKILLVLLIALNFLSCSKENNNDSSSLNFEVEVQNITDRSATVSWTRPEGSNIRFQVFLNNELIADNLRVTVYDLERLSPKTTYNGKIIATSNGETSTVNFSFNTTQYTSNIYDGSVFLYNQEAINEFGSHHYDEILFNLTIESLGVYDLSPLHDLKIVHGDVNIKYSPFENLEGLENLNAIGGNLYFYNNQNLINLNGLESITRIDGKIQSYSNRFLNDISGLKNVRGFKGGLEFEETKIREITIFQDATSLENLYLGYNPELHNISGLRNVTEIEDYLDLGGNNALMNLNALSAINHINGDVHISSPAISSIGLVNLESVGGILDLFFLPGITDLDDLSNLRSFAILIIWANENLVDLCGLSSAVINMNIPVDISGNPYNPTLEDFINGDCSL